MAVLVANDPCDNFTFAPWIVGGSTAVTAGGQTGNGFSFASGSGQTVRYAVPDPQETDTITTGFHIKITTVKQHDFLRFSSDEGSSVHVFVRLAATGSLSVYRGPPASPTLIAGPTAGGVIVANTWHYLEMSVKLGDAPNGAFTLKVDATTLLTQTGIDTFHTGSKTTLDSVSLFGVSSTTTWLIDNVYVRNDATFGTGTAVPQVKTWNGSAFVAGPVKVWNGTTFVDAVAVKTWNGSAFV